MTEREHLLACLAEECAEVAQRATKALRFGLSEVQPGQPHDNAERVALELDDLMTVVLMLHEAGALRWPTIRAGKVARVLKMMEYARSVGALEPRPAESVADVLGEGAVAAGPPIKVPD